MLSTKLPVNWPFGSGEEVKNRFPRWQPQQPSCTSDRHDFSYFLTTSHPDASYQVSSPFDPGEEANKKAKMALYCSPDYQTSLNQLAFRFMRKSSILIFKMAAILDFQSE